ncbi:MAG: Clp protease N-terminal domain-containing protein, partial [Candidatus Binatia bacterium]
VDPPAEYLGTVWPPTRQEQSEPEAVSPPTPSDSYLAAVSFARNDASSRGTSELEPAHLLLGVLNVADSVVLEAFSRLKLSAEVVANSIERQLPAPTAGAATDIHESKMVRRALAFAQHEAQAMRSPAMGPAHILIGLIRAGESVAAEALQTAGFNVYAFREEIFGINREES